MRAISLIRLLMLLGVLLGIGVLLTGEVPAQAILGGDLGRPGPAQADDLDDDYTLTERGGRVRVAKADHGRSDTHRATPARVLRARSDHHSACPLTTVPRFVLHCVWRE